MLFQQALAHMYMINNIYQTKSTETYGQHLSYASLTFNCTKGEVKILHSWLAAAVLVHYDECLSYIYSVTMYQP